MTKKQFVVIGNPINHSKSPLIHSLFAEQTGINMEYKLLLADKEEFSKSADLFFEYGLGANITVPFKEDALNYADKLSERAKLAGAVNTLHRLDNIIYGDNTDGIGLVRDIKENNNIDVFGKKILLIGAGGASRGVILPILSELPAQIIITNRTLSKAKSLATKFSNYGNIQAMDMSQIESGFDIIINATSASLTGDSLNINKDMFKNVEAAYDMMYSKKLTPLLEVAKANGVKTIDGIGMLIEQAAESFYIWNGIRPNTSEVFKRLREIE